MTLSCGFILVQLNNCVVVRGSVLQRGHSDDVCLSILLKYECRVGQLFVPSWVRVRGLALGCVVSE